MFEPDRGRDDVFITRSVIPFVSSLRFRTCPVPVRSSVNFATLAEAHPEEASGQVADHAAELASLVEYLELQVAPLIDAVESRSGPL